MSEAVCLRYGRRVLVRRCLPASAAGRLLAVTRGWYLFCRLGCGGPPRGLACGGLFGCPPSGQRWVSGLLGWLRLLLWHAVERAVIGWPASSG